MAVEKTIQTAVAEQISKIHPRVESMVVDKLVDRAIEARVVPIAQGMDKLKELEEELKKIDHFDSKTFNADGSVKDQSYSGKRIEELKKLRDRIAKLIGAIQKAFDHGDIKDLNQLLQSKQDKAEGGAKDTGETT